MAHKKDNRIIPELDASNIKNQTPFETAIGFDTENYTCFGVMPEDKRAICLKILFGNGAIVLIQYGRMVSPITFNGSNEIKINTPTLCLVIQGSNLAPLMEYIGDNRLAWIRSSSADSMTDSMMMRDGEPEILTIQIQSKAKQPKP